jgi:hypothetical protein
MGDTCTPYGVQDFSLRVFFVVAALAKTQAKTIQLFQECRFAEITKSDLHLTPSKILLQYCDFKDHKKTDAQWAFLYLQGWMSHEQLSVISKDFISKALSCSEPWEWYNERIACYQAWNRTPPNNFLCDDCGGNPTFIYPKNKPYVCCIGCWPGIFVNP